MEAAGKPFAPAGQLQPFKNNRREGEGEGVKPRRRRKEKGSNHSIDSAEKPLWSKSDSEKDHLRCIPRTFKSRTDEISA
jgi:hypothetical protein